MIRLQNVLKMSSRRICETFWRRFEDVLKTSWKRVSKASLKTYGQDDYIGLDQDVLKTSSENVWLIRIYSSSLRRLEDVLKTSFEDEDERRLQDVFKTNVCWDSTWNHIFLYFTLFQGNTVRFLAWKTVKIVKKIFFSLDSLFSL